MQVGLEEKKKAPPPQRTYVVNVVSAVVLRTESSENHRASLFSTQQ